MNNKKNCLVVSIIPHNLTDLQAFNDLKELKFLIDSYGGKVSDYVLQRREVHDKGMYIGRGKINYVANLIKQLKIDVVILNAIVNPGHIYDMKKIWQRANPNINVWDRVDLILNIFSSHANTAEAKLQIDLAAMRHMGPRIYGMGEVLSRQAGSIGARGIGETNSELMKRHWREQIKKTNDRLEKLLEDRRRQVLRRKKSGLKTVSLIGYTNAGKTSLFNILTGKNKYVKDQLFATLDSHVGQMKNHKPNSILVSDTIGFINNLPANLIEAFKSTLLESTESDLLLHVIDISDEDLLKKMEVVENILKDLDIHNKRRILIFNKIEIANEVNKIEISKKYTLLNPQFISVRNNQGISKLMETIEKYL